MSEKLLSYMRMGRTPQRSNTATSGGDEEPQINYKLLLVQGLASIFQCLYPVWALYEATQGNAHHATNPAATGSVVWALLNFFAWAACFWVMFRYNQVRSPLNQPNHTSNMLTNPNPLLPHTRLLAACLSPSWPGGWPPLRSRCCSPLC